MTARLPEPPLSPVGCLSLLWPRLPGDWVSDADRAGLEAAAAALPPVPAVALEVRLRSTGGAVDLHQLITRSHLHLLPPWLATHPPRTAPERQLHQFLNNWANGEVPEVAELYLEWDRPADPSADPAPGVFVALEPGYTPLSPALGAFCGAAALERLASVRAKLPEDATVNFLGIMLGRGGALRVNLRQLLPGELGPFLTAIGWPGDIAAAERRFEALVRICDRVGVALDFTPELTPTIGFELFIHNSPAMEPRYRALLDRIEALGLCTRWEREALAALDTLLPCEAEGQPWPAAWLIAAAARPPCDVPLLKVRLSHLKLSLDARGNASAKAYISAKHHWASDTTELPPLAPPGRTHHAVRAAAVDFLGREQGQDGLWRDFDMSVGASDHWVTAVVGLAVGRHAPRAAERARTAMLLYDPAKGWGYNVGRPVDSDSSAWALRFLRLLDSAEPHAPAIEAFLEQHFLPHGFATYAPVTPVRYSVPVADDSGWRGAHDCVAANAAGAATGALRERLLALLVERQRPEGHWRAHWWVTDFLGTGLAIQALGPCEARRRAFDRMRDQTASNDFDLAWQAMALREGDAADQAAAAALVARLAAHQLADGSWPSGSKLLYPVPQQLTRSPTEPFYPDHRRLFTTASALMALDALS